MSKPQHMMTKRTTLLDSANLKMTNLSQYSESDENLSASHKVVYTYEKQIKKDKNFWSNVDSLSINQLKDVQVSKENLLLDEKQDEEIKESLDSVKSGESVFKVQTLCCICNIHFLIYKFLVVYV